MWRCFDPKAPDFKRLHMMTVLTALCILSIGLACSLAIFRSRAYSKCMAGFVNGRLPNAALKKTKRFVVNKLCYSERQMKPSWLCKDQRNRRSENLVVSARAWLWWQSFHFWVNYPFTNRHAHVLAYIRCINMHMHLCLWCFFILDIFQVFPCLQNETLG